MIGEDAWQRGHVACDVTHRTGERDDCCLAFGEAVEVAHSVLPRRAFPRETADGSWTSSASLGNELCVAVPKLLDNIGGDVVLVTKRLRTPWDSPSVDEAT